MGVYYTVYGLLMLLISIESVHVLVHTYILSECGELCDVGNVRSTLPYPVHQVFLVCCLSQPLQFLLNLGAGGGEGGREGGREGGMQFDTLLPTLCNTVLLITQVH